MLSGPPRRGSRSPPLGWPGRSPRPARHPVTEPAGLLDCGRRATRRRGGGSGSFHHADRAAPQRPKANAGDAVIRIYATIRGEGSPPSDAIGVSPGGGPGSIYYQGFPNRRRFKVSPNVGDQLTVSVYYDRQGHNYFTAADLTQHTTQTIRETSPGGIARSSTTPSWTRRSSGRDATGGRHAAVGVHRHPA